MWWDIAKAIWAGIKSFLGLDTPKISNDERLGQNEVVAQAGKQELIDAKKSVDANDTAIAVDAAGGLRAPHPGDQPWNPDGLG